ncbi:MAG: hypothetical protein ABWY38_06880 [Methyloceanibacter sp.]
MYGDAAQAADLLEERFASDMPASEMWVRAKDAVTRMVGDDLFVALPGEGSIHTLNAMAAAV